MSKPKEKTREKLIAAATQLFLKRSYESVSTTEICVTAGVSKGSIYNHFLDKNALLLRVIENHTATLIESIAQIDLLNIPAKEKIVKFVHLFLTEAENSTREFGMVCGNLLGNLALEMSTLNRSVKQTLTQCFDAISVNLEPIMRDFMRQQRVLLNATDAVTYVLSAVQGSVILAKVRNDPSYISLTASTICSTLIALAENKKEIQNAI